MRVLLISRPTHPVPMEMLPMMFEAFAGWRERNKGHMESFYFFASGGGGCGVLNVADVETVTQIVMEYPFAAFSSVTTDPIIDGDKGIGMFREVLKQMSAAMGQ